MRENPGARNAWGTDGWSRSEILLFAKPVPGQSSASPNGGGADCRLQAGQRAAPTPGANLGTGHGLSLSSLYLFFCFVWPKSLSTWIASQLHPGVSSMQARTRKEGPGLWVSNSVTCVFLTNLIWLSQHRSQLRNSSLNGVRDVSPCPDSLGISRDC